MALELVGRVFEQELSHAAIVARRAALRTTPFVEIGVLRRIHPEIGSLTVAAVAFTESTLQFNFAGMQVNAAVHDRS
jgi:hypothetical protein